MRRVTLAGARVTILGGATKRIRLRLTNAGRGPLASHYGRLHATLILAVHKPSNLTTTEPITLRGR